MDKILALADSPIRTWSHNLHELSILFLDEKVNRWFFSNFIQLFCENILNRDEVYPLNLKFYEYHENEEDWFYYTLMPLRFLKTQRIFKGVLNEVSNDIINFIINNINNDRYVYTSVNEFYIPRKEAYQNFNLNHDVFIHGYDLKEETFHVVGYYENTFLNEKIKFSDFKNGYLNTGDLFGTSGNPYYSSLYLIEPNFTREYEFNLLLVKEMCFDYLNSNNTAAKLSMFNNPVEQRVFGLAVYKQIIYYHELIKNGQRSFDIRPLHLLWEHKNCMNKRLEFMASNSLFSPSPQLCSMSKDLLRDSLVVRNSMLRYKFTNEPGIIDRIILKLQSMRERDKLFMSKLLEELDKY